MTDLDQQLTSLAPQTQVAQLLRDLVARRSVLTDRRGSYISVRPAPTGAIAAYFHAQRVSIAVEPNDAATVAARFPRSSYNRTTPATS